MGINGPDLLVQPRGAAGGGIPLTSSRASASVILDASGNGTAEVQIPTTERWYAQRLVVTCTGAAVPAIRVYDGPTGDPGALIDGGANGQLNVSDFGQALQLNPGDILSFVWTGGDAAAVATARVVGLYELS